jgi:hypothetical protein
MAVSAADPGALPVVPGLANFHFATYVALRIMLSLRKDAVLAGILGFVRWEKGHSH